MTNYRYGHYNVLLLDGVHNVIRSGLDLKMSSKSIGNVWEGAIYIPREYLPANVSSCQKKVYIGSKSRQLHLYMKNLMSYIS